jgi:hypothetical protein
MSVFPRFFCFIAFSSAFHRWELKKQQKIFCKQILSKTNRNKKIQTDFSSIFFHQVFGRFSVRGVKTMLKKLKNHPKNLTLVLFWPLTHPPTTGVTDLFSAAPAAPTAPPSWHPRAPSRTAEEELKLRHSIHLIS